MQSNQVVFLLGPTASGKTKLSLMLAQALNAEIINSDAFSFYKNCDILTAKVTDDEKAKIPHHMIDILDVTDNSYTVNDYLRDATDTITSIHEKGKAVIVVGGSNYYTETLIYKSEQDGDKQTEVPKLEITNEDRDLIQILLDKGEVGEVSEVGTLLSSKYGYMSRFHVNDVRRRKNEFQRLIAENSLSLNHSLLKYPNSKIIVMELSNTDFATAAVNNRIESMIHNNKGLEEIFWVLKSLDDQQKLDQKAKCGVLQAIGYKEFISLYEYQKQINGMMGEDMHTSSDKNIHDDKFNQILKTCMAQLSANTLKLIKKQKKWLKIRILGNSGLNDRLLKLVLDVNQLNKPDIDSYFNEIVLKFKDYVDGGTFLHHFSTVDSKIIEELFECKLCHSSFNKRNEFRAHSKTHRKMVNDLRPKESFHKINMDKPSSVQCVTCDRLIPTEYMKHHAKSRAHKMRERKTESTDIKPMAIDG